MASTEGLALASYANAVRIPSNHDRVHKDECFFSFDSPDSEDGLYVCMHSFLGFGRSFVERYQAKTGRKVFLRLKRTKKPIEAASDGGSDSASAGQANGDTGVPEKVSRLAIGVDGGFNPDAKKFEYVEDSAVVLVPEFERFSIGGDDGLPLSVSMSARSILSAESATRRRELEAASGTWEGDRPQVSKHAATLEQLDNGVKVPPRGWRCHKCDLTTNLWLNLTDGAISCGRRFFDGSGGNDHGVEHYAATKHPLAVKLGTITADGKADVFSYVEDDMVEDPELKRHLAHFGINLQAMEKTDKSMLELEIDMNQRANEWLTLTESGSKLVPVYGRGFTGMENLGNTCYLNSVMQVLFTLPSFVREYVEGAEAAFEGRSFDRSHEEDFRFQMCKLGTGLLSGRYSVKPVVADGSEDKSGGERAGIRPAIFKAVVGKGHPEFSGKQQQDAQEFFLYLLTLMEKENKRCGRSEHAFRCLQFEVEDRHECGLTRKVKYMTRVEDYLPLAIPLEATANKKEVEAFKKRKAEVEAAGGRLKPEDLVRPLIPFAACVSKFSEEEQVDDFYSSAAKAKTFARKTMRLKTFPDYLVVQLKKFDVDANWVPYKLDVEVEMPDTIELGALRTEGGLKDGEELLPQDEDDDAKAQKSVEPDPGIVEQLSEMGFSIEGCKKAAVHTKNSGVEAAMNWVMEHMGDADFNEPFVGSAKKSSFVPNEEALANLMAMSFTRAQAVKALRSTDNNVERAVDWIFSHSEDPGDDGEVAGAGGGGSSSNLTDGSPRYKMKAFISHMGNSHMVGHYVCHILKGDRWVIYNDEKVSLSENAPKNLGYLYLYERDQ